MTATYSPELAAAIRSKRADEVKRILAEHPEQLRIFTPFAGGTWLHYAAREGAQEVVLELLRLGVDPNSGDKREGRAAICDAALGGNAEVVGLLLEAGTRLDVSDPVRNPLFSAIVGRSMSVCRLILEAGIDPLVTYTGANMKGMGAIAFAIERGEVEIAKLIARAAANGDGAREEWLLAEGRAVATANNA